MFTIKNSNFSPFIYRNNLNDLITVSYKIIGLKIFKIKSKFQALLITLIEK